MEPSSLRIYLTGRLCLEVSGSLTDQQAFPSQQARLAFAYLICERSQPISRTELAHVLWPQGLPPSWDSSLSAVVSTLRALIGSAGLDGSAAITGAAGCYEVRLPRSSWVDTEAAVDSIHEAEAALEADDPASAYGPSAVAHHIARRPFLPGEEGTWIEHRREKLRSILIRALECRAEVYLWNREFPLAVEAARDAVTLEPFREACYRQLMRAHAAAGNSAEALRVYQQCRQLISEELGANPSSQTRAVHNEILQSL